MNIDACPVAELGRLMYAQFDALADAGRDDDEDARKAAHAWVSALCVAQTTVQATSWRGVMLQLNEHRAIDDDLFNDPDIAAAIEKAGRADAVQTKNAAHRPNPAGRRNARAGKSHRPRRLTAHRIAEGPDVRAPGLLFCVQGRGPR
jgi:hypothetical protein